MMKTLVQYNTVIQEISESNPKSHSCLYLYGIIASREGINFGDIGIGGKPVYTICYNDIAAVVSAADDDPSPDSSAARRQHNKTLNKIRLQVAILPMDYRENLTLSDIKRTLTTRYTRLKIQLVRLNSAMKLRVKP